MQRSQPETSYDTSDPHASHPYFDLNAAIIVILVIIVVSLASRYQITASGAVDVSNAPISTPALPAPAPIYYQPVPTLVPVSTPIIITRDIDNSDHRICVFVVDCSQAK